MISERVIQDSSMRQKLPDARSVGEGCHALRDLNQLAVQNGTPVVPVSTGEKAA